MKRKIISAIVIVLALIVLYLLVRSVVGFFTNKSNDQVDTKTKTTISNIEGTTKQKVAGGKQKATVTSPSTTPSPSAAAPATPPTTAPSTSSTSTTTPGASSQTSTTQTATGKTSDANLTNTGPGEVAAVAAAVAGLTAVFAVRRRQLANL